MELFLILSKVLEQAFILNSTILGKSSHVLPVSWFLVTVHLHVCPFVCVLFHACSGNCSCTHVLVPIVGQICVVLIAILLVCYYSCLLLLAHDLETVLSDLVNPAFARFKLASRFYQRTLVWDACPFTCHLFLLAHLRAIRWHQSTSAMIWAHNPLAFPPTRTHTTWLELRFELDIF